MPPCCVPPPGGLFKDTSNPLWPKLNSLMSILMDISAHYHWCAGNPGVIFGSSIIVTHHTWFSDYFSILITCLLPALWLSNKLLRDSPLNLLFLAITNDHLSVWSTNPYHSPLYFYSSQVFKMQLRCFLCRKPPLARSHFLLLLGTIKTPFRVLSSQYPFMKRTHHY